VSDPVNPAHYQGDRVMCLIEDFALPFTLGNVVKYILREKNKAGLEDLKKARWYLDREIGNRRELRQFRGASAAIRLLRALELDDIVDDSHIPIEQVEAELRAQGIDIEALQERTRKLIADLKAKDRNPAGEGEKSG